MTAEFRRLGKRGSYRLGQLRAQGVGAAARPVPFQPQFIRPDHRWPASVWLLGLLAGTMLIAGAAKAGWWFAPFVVSALAGVTNWIGGWRARVALPAITVMAAAGWAVPLAWAELRGQPYGEMARVIAAILGLPASAVTGLAVTLLVAVAQAVVGYWLGRALTPHRTRRNPRDYGKAAEVGRLGTRPLVNHESVTDPELVRRARNAGVSTDYQNWRGRRVKVSDETLASVLRVLDQAPEVDAIPRAGRAAAYGPQMAAANADRPRLSVPAERQWGFTVQLYSVRSKESWGHGDLHDLARLARWSAAQLGAGFVLINPLHAAEPLSPISPSPYLPMTRLFTSPLYIRVENVPEYGDLPAEDKRTIHEIATPLRAANATADLIDRDTVWRGKRAALELIAKVPLIESRQEAYAAFRAERGRALQQWCTWCALAEAHGADWRDWPTELADPARAAEVVAGDEKLTQAAEFHAWLQWQADEQLAAAQDAAKSAGMAYGIIHDLAIGTHPGGADAWANQRLLAPGFSVGAPPDGFNQLGQDWAQPPWNPGALAAEAYLPMAELFEAAMRHAGGLRVDHVMGLMRLWWVPLGQPPDRGTYVSYDHHAAVGALVSAAARAGAVAVGEDLGTVAPWIHEYLAEQGILGTMMLWFADAADGTPLRPPDWRRDCMATVGTHDVPPVFGFVTGDQVTIRARLGLLKTSEKQERGESEAMLARWRAALIAEGLLPPDQQPSPAEFTVALYGYLHKTPAVLVGVSLADAVGDRRTQNIPGTRDEYPNWRIPLCDDTGRPVLLEELPAVDLLRAVCQAVSPAVANQR